MGSPTSRSREAMVAGPKIRCHGFDFSLKVAPRAQPVDCISFFFFLSMDPQCSCHLTKEYSAQPIDPGCVMRRYHSPGKLKNSVATFRTRGSDLAGWMKS